MGASRKILPPEMCMAGGGLIPDLGDIPIPGSSFDVDGGGSTTFKTGGQIPPPPMAAQAMPMAPVPPPIAPQPTMSPMAPMPPTQQAPMPSMLDVLRQAQVAGNQLYGQYTPDKRNELYLALLQRRNGTGNAIGSGLAAVGDAISRGYGRTNTDFLNKTQEGQEQATKEGLGAFDEGQKATLAATSAGMELQKMDPNSAASKIAKEAYAPLLKKLGYSDESLQRMSGANVEAVSKVAAEYGGKEMENLYRQAMLAVQQMQAQAEIANKVQGRRADAVKQLAEHPISSMLPTATNAALKQEAGLAGPTTGQVSSGPYGDTVKRGDKTYVWSPVTHKYHPQ